jgi:adenylate kinase
VNADYAPVDGAGCSRCGGKLKQRADDNIEVVRERLKIYHRNTEPLVDYYRSRPTFRSVNGAQPPDKVAADLVAAIEEAGSLGAAR